MSSRKPAQSLPYGKIEDLLERVIGEIRASDNIELLNECRALFRKKTPLSLRAYVAAALLLQASGGARPEGRRDRRDGQDKRDKRREGKPDGKREEKRDERRNENRDERKHEREKTQVPREADDALPKTEARFREGRYAGEGVTLFMSAGRRQHIYARHVFRLLSDVPEANEDTIGSVRVLDNYSFITVDPSVEEAVIAGLGGKSLRGRALVVNRARKRPTEETDAERSETGRADDDESDDLPSAEDDAIDAASGDGSETDGFDDDPETDRD